MEIHGSDGIPRHGREVEYATQLWLEGPSAFWLHPEGPLSDTTPEEWLAKREEEDRQRREAEMQNPMLQYARMGLLQSAAAQAAMSHRANLLQVACYQSQLHAGWQNRQAPGLFDGLLGFRL